MPSWIRSLPTTVPSCFRLARRILGQGPDSEDVAQEVFLEAFQLRQRQTSAMARPVARNSTRRALDRCGAGTGTEP